ncbi:MAG: hypothetical protein ABSH44_10035 [Bryobacteraceae bacterium]|jgi:hypothetical protein
MKVKASRLGQPEASPKPEAAYGLSWLVSAAVGAAWTALGGAIAAIQGTTRTFLQEWGHLEGFFLIGIGTWLLLMIRSKVFESRIANLTVGSAPPHRPVSSPRIQTAIVCAVGVLGTASLVSLGFPARGLLLYFMWTTCACICFVAGAATSHTIEVIVAVHGLLQQDIKAFRYAPARTPELRSVVSYFSSFTLLVTIGYAFAVLGTLDQHWTGSTAYVAAVRLFWPVIYVPTCTVAMIYPHIVVHKLIRREKEKTLLSCQEDMDELLGRFHDLKSDDINRTNTLAQLFDRIVATPDYVLDFGIAVRTLLPVLVNVASFFAKSVFTHGQAGP